MTSALEKEKPSVNILLEAWQATSEWESQMSRRFGQSVSCGSSKFPAEAKVDLELCDLLDEADSGAIRRDGIFRS